MNNDPIISIMTIFIRRLLIFIILSVLLGVSILTWVLLVPLDVPARELISWLRLSLAPEESKLPRVVFYGAMTIGTLTISVIFLLIGRWWKKRAMVQQHRGARLDDLGA